MMLKDPYKVRDRPADFNATDYEKFIDMVLYFMLQLIFKKLPLVWFWYCIEKEYLQLSVNMIKILFIYILAIFVMYLCGQVFSIYFNQNNILQQTECKSGYETLFY